MTDRRSSLFWGLVFLVAGAFLLLVTTDILPELSAQTWAILCTGAAAVLLLGYLFTGWRNWYFLFPGAVSAAVAALLWLTEGDVAGSAAAGLFMAIISVPFWVGYLVDPKANRWALIPGWAVAAIGLILLFEQVVSDSVFVSLILLAIALPFLAVYLLDRRQWWALIPAYVLAVIGLIFLLIGDEGELLPVLIMFAIAVPFLVVFLRDRRQWWALIPAGVLGAVGIFLLVAITGSNLAWTPALILFGIALPFLAIYFLRRDQWWALLPAGALTGAGLTIIIAAADLNDSATERLAGAAVLGCLALTFGYLWWKRKLHQTDWAGVPALLLGLGALAVLIFGLRVEIILAVGLIAFGGWILLRAMRPQPKGR